jgi:hypothetical protein
MGYLISDNRDCIFASPPKNREPWSHIRMRHLMSDNRDWVSEPGILTVCGTPYGPAMIPAGGVGCDF